jgi:hypothetical protein
LYLKIFSWLTIVDLSSSFQYQSTTLFEQA